MADHTYLLAMFDDEEPVLRAVERIREAGIEIHDVMSPFPIHGIDDALGARESKLHTAGFLFGATGTAFALLAISTISVFDWPNNFGGKPFFSMPSWIPITFELTVLFSAVGMTIVYYIRNGLSVFKDVEVLEERTSSDRFAIVFDMGKYGEDTGRIRNILDGFGPLEFKTKTLDRRHPSHEEQSTVGFQWNKVYDDHDHDHHDDELAIKDYTVHPEDVIREREAAKALAAKEAETITTTTTTTTYVAGGKTEEEITYRVDESTDIDHHKEDDTDHS